MTEEPEEQEQVSVVIEPEENDDAPEDAAPEEAQEDAAPEESEEIEILVGDEKPEEAEEDEEAAPAWIKTVRQQARDTKKENQELKRRLREIEAKAPTPTAPPELGEEPTLEGHDYDPAAYAAALKVWMQKEQEQNRRKAAVEREQQEAQVKWNKKLSDYGEKKAKLRVVGFDDAEAVAQEHLHPAQLGMVIHRAKDPAKVMYAIGKDEARAKALAAITDLADFAVEIYILEMSLKTTPKSAPPPSTIPKGSGSKIGSNATLDKLREEAAKTGDMSKVMAYKRQMANK